jgi:Flp pilus assembly protein TadD
MVKRGLIIAFLSIAVAGCQNTSRLEPLQQGLDAPEGTVVLRNSVDGLTVGHRLMEAGEYELALRAYMRAAGEQGATTDVLSALGSANLQLRRLGQAERLLRQAIEIEPDFPAAWNNLGVVLMERGEYGEARQVFRHAYALDSGESDDIRENLRLAIANMENSVYADPYNDNDFDLERRGDGRYVLIQTP